jgi:polyisoprenoid-binding protein YceI
MCCHVAALLFAQAIAASAQQQSFELDPAKTTVTFTLDATLHTVHGTFKAKEGNLRFDPKSGEAGGKIVVDAKSAETGNSGRDNKMHKEVLESEKYEEISFSPTHISGTVSPGSTIELQGTFHIHGGDHPLHISVPLEMKGEEVVAKLHFVVPYVEWGMKNPSTLVLRVSKDVSIDIVATGHLRGAASQQ